VGLGLNCGSRVQQKGENQKRFKNIFLEGKEL